ncbi:MAG: hypothetical protein HQL20_04180 [Candidatus Omnitrophica bacterium]|nr:hypothetical protein [Candidatus Omnitrophota bacterium]
MDTIKRFIAVLILVPFLLTTVTPVAMSADLPWMPQPGAMVGLSAPFVPAHLWGMTIKPNEPFKFDFLVKKGDVLLNEEQKRSEYSRLIKYFLAALAIPDTDQWVNLSPYEQNRIVPDNFGLTEMGRDLLAQDYLLKQLSSSLTDPGSELGQKFWANVYEEAHKRFGTTDVPADMYSKVWITPDKAVVYEKNNTVYILESHLKVMTEQDYLAAQHNSAVSPAVVPDSQARELADISSRVLKEVIIPAIEKEVNEGKSFAPLRQVYSGMLLATWYKKALKESILGKLYADRSKVKGVDQDPRANQEIYGKYVEAFKKGVFNLIKEDVDRNTQEVIPRKYFSGGFDNASAAVMSKADNVAIVDQALSNARGGNTEVVEADLARANQLEWKRLYGRLNGLTPGSRVSFNYEMKYGTGETASAKVSGQVVAINPDNALQLRVTKRGSKRTELEWYNFSRIQDSVLTFGVPGASDVPNVPASANDGAAAVSLSDRMMDVPPRVTVISEAIRIFKRLPGARGSDLSVEFPAKYKGVTIEDVGGVSYLMWRNKKGIPERLGQVKFGRYDTEVHSYVPDMLLSARLNRSVKSRVLLSGQGSPLRKTLAQQWLMEPQVLKNDEPIEHRLGVTKGQGVRYLFELPPGYTDGRVQHEDDKEYIMATDPRGIRRTMGWISAHLGSVEAVHSNVNGLLWAARANDTGKTSFSVLPSMFDRDERSLKKRLAQEWLFEPKWYIMNDGYSDLRVGKEIVEQIVELPLGYSDGRIDINEFNLPVVSARYKGGKRSVVAIFESGDIIKFKSMIAHLVVAARIVKTGKSRVVLAGKDRPLSQRMSREWHTEPQQVGSNKTEWVATRVRRWPGIEVVIEVPDLYSEPFLVSNKSLEGGSFIKAYNKAGRIVPLGRINLTRTKHLMVHSYVEGLIFAIKDTTETKNVNVVLQSSDKAAGDADAAVTTVAAKAPTGGIDLAQSALSMQIKRDGAGVPLPVSQQDLDSIHIEGLVPVITGIRSAVNAPQFSALP